MVQAMVADVVVKLPTATALMAGTTRSNCTSTTAAPPDATVAFCVCVKYPVAVMASAKAPGCNPAKAKLPFWSAVAVRSTPVASVTVTVAARP